MDSKYSVTELNALTMTLSSHSLCLFIVSSIPCKTWGSGFTSRLFPSLVSYSQRLNKCSERQTSWDQMSYSFNLCLVAIFLIPISSPSPFLVVFACFCIQVQSHKSQVTKTGTETTGGAYIHSPGNCCWVPPKKQTSEWDEYWPWHNLYLLGYYKLWSCFVSVFCHV